MSSSNEIGTFLKDEAGRLANGGLQWFHLLMQWLPEARERALQAASVASAARLHRDIVMLCVLYENGLRIRDLCQANTDDVRFDPALASFELHLTSAGRPERGDGSKRERNIAIGEKLAASIWDYHVNARPLLVTRGSDERALWIGDEGRRMDPVAFSSSVRMHYVAAGGKGNCDLVSLRRNYALLMSATIAA